MSCAFEEDLTAYLDGELPQARSAEVKAHLAGCPDCRATEALLRSTVEQLHALPAFEPSRAMRRELLAKVDAIPPPWLERLKAFFRPWVLLPTGGVVAAAVVLAVIGLEHRHRRPMELSAPAQLELAMNYDVVENYEVLGVDSPEDLDVVEHLQDLEKTP